MLRRLDMAENVWEMHPATGIRITERDFARLSMHWIFHERSHSNLLTSTDAL